MCFMHLQHAAHTYHWLLQGLILPSLLAEWQNHIESIVGTCIKQQAETFHGFASSGKLWHRQKHRKSTPLSPKLFAGHWNDWHLFWSCFDSILLPTHCFWIFPCPLESFWKQWEQRTVSKKTKELPIFGHRMTSFRHQEVANYKAVSLLNSVADENKTLDTTVDVPQVPEPRCLGRQHGRTRDIREIHIHHIAGVMGWPVWVCHKMPYQTTNWNKDVPQLIDDTKCTLVNWMILMVDARAIPLWKWRTSSLIKLCANGCAQRFWWGHAGCLVLC